MVTNYPSPKHLQQFRIQEVLKTERNDKPVTTKETNSFDTDFQRRNINRQSPL